ncbi:DNA-binding response regulator [Shewanella sp. SR43-4]|jgi:DNA-binding NarL/FixJ family response regulator|uniref:LuxR C-terminal-related transcriptional regulator n=1 Tax=Shewanella vesiculosa TaxID=518738 RepID=A0ABV0FLL1_9GAMM|nr:MULTISPECIES: LuxR C-terminal-related transcriptional regulator [Shewanella]NCQ43527.1 DNA-binding response regulator [Shewanella frigidimarina]MBB1316519.1 DNA-binding response regulator [Shewanella sp. SR43-4]MBB1320716.1 DNA-binding response regulator [Shewanella sp. SR43-8]MBB1391087.1 DNA-binding response regulator [Shewanella sp. SG44-6]MBB1477270.1 DNA-binding response regulator [Shewanella sp. SG41-3]|tara:strand:+ start:7399 stop:8028 length:630 start_codon:yes stop_codon:yes gene_type:complete
MFKVVNWMIVSRSELLVDLLDCRWPQEFLVKLTKTQPSNMAKMLAVEPIVIVFFDLSTIDLQQAYQLQRLIEREYCSIHTVFINFPKQLDTRFLIHPLTIGVFYTDSSLAEISIGLNDIMKGRRVIPQDLLRSMVDDDNHDDNEQLTIREREVLQTLLTGSTNLDIANQLFVSESTIKTHLYRAFRKIGVSSRGQAIAWAQTHMHEVRL